MQQNDRGSEERIVVTGTGMITALGHNVPDTWSAIVAGESGLGEITLFDKELHSSGGACEVKDFDPAEMLGRREARRRDRHQQFATVAAREAMEQAQLTVNDDNRERIGLSIGTGVGGIQTLVEQEHVFLEKGHRLFSEDEFLAAVAGVPLSAILLIGVRVTI